jgi:ABC-type branched-subunit amino acid transport system ATPase component/branched-subunit amino acid ABC-type transport system permease component
LHAVLQVVVIGLCTGAIYGLLGQGVVMIYRGSGVVNIAQGGFAMIAAYLFYQFTVSRGWPVVPSMLATVAFAGVLGFLTDIFIMRPLRGQGSRTPTIVVAGAAIVVLILKGVGLSLQWASVCTLGVIVVGIAISWATNRGKPNPLRTLLGQGGRRSEASPLIRVIATLGILAILIASATLAYGTATVGLTSSLFPTRAVSILGVAVGLDQVLSLLVCLAMSAILYVVYRYTRVGLATTAVAENPRSASALGWSPTLVSSLNWSVGTALAGLAGVLILPITGLSIDNLALLIVPALTAVLIGNFRSFPITFVAALLLGVIEQAIQSPPDGVGSWPILRNVVALPGAFQAVPFVIIVIVLVCRGAAIPERGRMLERLPAIGTGRVRPLVVLPIVLLAAGLLLFANIPTEWTAAITVSAGAAIVMLSVVVVTGYAGQLSLAQFALAGVSAVTAGRLVYSQGWPFELAMIAGVLVAAGVGAVFALPALRTRGVNLAVITLGLGLALEYTVFTNAAIAGPDNGLYVGGQTFLGWDINPITHANRYALFTLGCLVAVSIVVANLRRSSSGRQLIAIRGNERSAAALGISTTRNKIFAFVISGGIAGLGGILLTFAATTLEFGHGLDPYSSILVVAISAIGGIGYAIGPLFAAPLWAGGIGTLIGDQFSSLALYVPIIGGISLILLLMQDFNGMAHFNVKLGEQLEVVWQKLVGKTRVAGKSATGDPRDPALTSTGADVIAVPPGRLAIRNLGVRYGNVRAVDGLSLEVSSGHIVGLIGPNGAGKTTVLDAISGFARPSDGEILFNGSDLTKLPDYRRALAGISRSFQSLELFEDMTVFENLMTACDRHNGAARLLDLVHTTDKPLPSAAAAAVREFGLAEDLDRRPEELSYGRRRLVAIARAIATAPAILLLDEPAAGLDSEESAELARLVRRLADDWQIGVLLIEHDMTFVMSVCDHLHVIDFGQPIAQGPPSVIQRDAAVIAAYLGVQSEEKQMRAVASPDGDGGRGVKLDSQ